MKIVRLAPGDGDRLRHLRLYSLSDTPDAFASTYELSAQKTTEDWALEASTLATFLAVSKGSDIGIVGVAPDQHVAEAAWLLSMWVAPRFRGQGVGDALVKAVIMWMSEIGIRRRSPSTLGTGSSPPAKSAISHLRVSTSLSTVECLF